MRLVRALNLSVAILVSVIWYLLRIWFYVRVCTKLRFFGLPPTFRGGVYEKLYVFVSTSLFLVDDANIWFMIIIRKIFGENVCNFA